MGIRFQCPNGHKLNVKADLAGKRAICPNCGARLVVPSASSAATTQADASPNLPDDSGGGQSSIILPGSIDARVETSVKSLVGLRSAATSESPPLEAAVWYVRSPGGLQFGPASEETLRTWINDRRVTPDAYVWRDGWPEWKRASDAADALPAPLVATQANAGSAISAPPIPAPSSSAPSIPGSSVNVNRESSPVAPEAPTEASEPASVAEVVDGVSVPATSYVARRNQSKRAQLTLAILMLLVVIVLAGILVWVIQWNSGPSAATQQQAATQVA